MFALCNFKNTEDKFVLADKQDFKEVAEQLNIVIDKELTPEEFDGEFSTYPLLLVNDLILRSLNNKARTTTHVLDELGISCWAALKKEETKIQEKASRLSRSQRDRVIIHYNTIKSFIQ